MLSFHSLGPAKLYAGTTTGTSKPKSTAMADTHGANGHLAAQHNGSAFSKNTDDSQSANTLAQQHTLLAHESRDSGVGDLDSTAGAQGHPPKSPTELGDNHETQNHTHSLDFTCRPYGAGPSQPQLPGSSRSSLQQDTNFSVDRPDETHHNAIAYRRDPETVIAYLVPMPKPTVQGAPLDVPTKYFLYSPPAPHLLKPALGRGGEGYVRRLNRRWQQSVREAKDDARNGGRKRFSPRSVRSKAVRGCVRGLERLKYDDVTFLSRIHPSTVTHLILIHPWALSGVQTPEEVLSTFRRQVFESKKKAKRDSFLSAALFLPALVIDTAAIFFGGLAEVDGIWMLVSVKAYRTAKVITRKLGPDPKTLEVERKQLVEDAKKSGFPPPPEPEPETDAEPGAIRRSVDALRKSMGSVKYRMRYRDSTRRSQSRKRKSGGDVSSEEGSRPQTTEAGFVGGGLGDHDEEEEGERPTMPESQSSQPEPEMFGFLEHYEEDEVVDDGQPGPSSARTAQGPGSGGVLVDSSDGPRASKDSGASDRSKKKGGSNFQLTFYPSPAMDALTQYLQENCHTYNSQSFQSATPAATEQDVLAMMGWHPERRPHATAEDAADDEQWQIRDVEDDLRLVAAKAAKAWDKSCRKQAKKVKRPLDEKAGKKRVSNGRFKARRPQAWKKSKAKTTPATSDSEADITPTTEKENRAVNIRARIAALRERTRRRKQTTNNNDSGEGGSAGISVILCGPCLRFRKNKTNTASEDEDQARQKEKPGRMGAMKRGLSSRGDALRQRVEARRATRRVPQDHATAAASVEGPTMGVAGIEGLDVEGETADVVDDGAYSDVIEDSNAQSKKPKRGRLLALPAGAAAAIGAAIKKKRQGRTKTSTTTNTEEGDSTGATAGKTSRFSALKNHLKSLRTRVTKKRRLSALKANFVARVPKHGSRRKSRKDEKIPKEKAVKEPKTVKEHGAIAGLVAGCLALPATTVRAVRDKRHRKSKPDFDMVDPTTAIPVAAQADMASPPCCPSIIVVPEDGTPGYQPPTIAEEEEPEPEAAPRPSTTQYLPGHGQSEIPVSTDSPPGAEEGGELAPERPRPEPRLASSDTAVNQTGDSTAEPPQQSPSAAAGVRFRSIRDGIGSFKPRRRTAEGNTDQQTVDGPPKTEPKKDKEAAAGNKSYQNLREGSKNFFKAKKSAGSDTPATEKPAVNKDLEKTVPPAGDSPSKEGRFKAIKDGIGNMKTKRAGTDAPPPKEKVYKDHSPGFIDRMRWVWNAA